MFHGLTLGLLVALDWYLNVCCVSQHVKLLEHSLVCDVSPHGLMDVHLCP